MDVEGGSEHTDPEQTELGDIGRLDADIPIEMPSAEAHNARVKTPPSGLQPKKSSGMMPHIALIGVGAPSASPPVRRKTRIRERAGKTWRWDYL